MPKRVSSTPYPPLERVTQPTLPTAAAAHYLNRSTRTLLDWAANESGPIKPVRVNGRHAWPVAEIKRLLGLSAQGGAQGGRLESWTAVEPHTTTVIDIPDINPLVTIVTPGGTIIQFYGIPGTPLNISSTDKPEGMAVRVNPGVGYPGGKPLPSSLEEVTLSAPAAHKPKGGFHGH